ncbi:UDP-N-acetylmuramoyl-L-alanine--D-glutamate ligase [Caulobacter sp. S45]|uniref:UDP-N-acetylmuramoyl-L-alanine--D-glutamate ligase n=1 Tax=Caulobacter sp. S45 TaxID=1641861 RepID=UPI0015770270|nr:UDP-N-acetylmuramoyl-L-alanine--D-glutamate ligase [Caulobacter sp. S45]
MIPVTGFSGKTVAVFGLARTGLTAARALVAGGAKLAVWDENADARARAAAEGLPLVDLSQADFSRFAALMVSPGVPLTHPEPHWVVNKAQAAGVEILGDIELFARTVNAAEPWKRPKIAAITGTNGKSTTTALLGHILNAAGKDALIGGNIGAGVLGLEGMHGGAVYVLELSSYQLDLTSSLRADAAVLLNVSPDHLDRHGGMEGYLAAKRRVFLNQDKGDTAIVGVDDAIGQNLCTELLALNRRTIRPISAGRAMGRGYYALQGLLYDATGERTVEVCDLSRAPGLPGRHNWQNAAAAYAAALALGVSPGDAADALMSFPGLAHRMEDVGAIGRVRFVNDSKATNADAARQAMCAIPKFYWIAGGREKAGGIAPLADLYDRVEKAYLIGEAAEDFARTLQGAAPVEACGTLERAVEHAWRDAAASGRDAVVLLSPACASFDQFPDFEVRGDAFRSLVQALRDPPARQAAG